MNILFCGTVVPESYDTKLRYLSPAANRFQINFCRELIRQGNKIEFLSYIGFPLEEGIPDFEKEQDFLDGTVEYVYRKRGSVVKGTCEFTKLMIKKIQKTDLLISYNVVYAWMAAPFLAKRMGSKSVLLLADFTEDSSYQNFKMKWYAKLQLHCIRNYDGVIGLSVNTKRFLKHKQFFMKMEGGISETVYDYFDRKSLPEEKIILMYSGLLEFVTGIDLLLEAFHKIENANIELWISGKGSLLEEVEKYAEIDKRIVNIGYLDYEQYLEKLRMAQILLNPRNMNLPENRNNFPSKIMEYLAAGKCIISTKFAGYERFEKYIIFCESFVEDIKVSIEKTIESEVYKDENIYLRNRRFSQNFLWKNQVQKILTKI